ncbi:hypothetical protein AX16_010005 [Volvariella volvacea WC 439]|nr:hypothetical protein AX16_010005 [Volvariella volvacea WC 439]
MNNPNSNYPIPHGSSPTDSNYPPRPQNEGHDEHTPRSEEEDDHAPQDPSRSEENDEDANTSLTAQALNPDGTPKRPMNAFMIFARRRRPQVSAQNQSMRTGEISKILSKEWATMPSVEKQFYLDQAKQLKETFNSKYPDYVYRRRPNNSRKGRKHKTLAARGMENPLPPEMADDMSAVGDLGETALTDGEEHQGSFTPPELQYSRVGEVPPSASRATGYQYPGIRSSPLSYPAADRLAHEPPSSSPRTLPPGSTPMGYSYIPSSGHQSSVYGTEPGTSQSHSQWERSEHSRSSGWSGHDAPMSSLSARASSYSPSPGTHWTGSTTPPIPPPSSGPSSSTYSFPTLTSPFYPNHPSQPQNNYPTPPSAASSSNSPTQFNTQSSQMHPPPTPLREYDDRFAPSPSISPNYPAGSRDPLLYSQRQSMPRSLPPVQSISSYPPSHLPSHQTPHSAPHPSQPAMRPAAGQGGYWDKTEPI